MNIVHFSHCNLGSAEASTAHVMEFADRLAQKGHRMTVVVPRKGVYTRPSPCDIRYFGYINAKGLRQITAIVTGFFKVLLLHRSKKFDCIYIRRLTLDPMPAIFSRICKVPLIVETNGQIEIHEFEVPLHALWPVFWYPLLRFFEWLLFSTAYAVTADGNKRLQKFKERYAKNPHKFHLVRSGGIDLQRFRRVGKSDMRTTLQLPPDSKLLVWVGTIFAWSGVDIIIDTAHRICEEFSDVQFIIIGEGPDRSRLMNKTVSLGLETKIKFPGYIATSELYRWLSACDVALAPYTRLRLDREDFTSYKIFEYLACGLPVVCSYEKGDSNIAYVSQYKMGETVPPEDPDAFATAVMRILNTPAYFEPAFTRQCRDTLSNLGVTWDGLVDQVEQLCIEAAAPRKR